MKNCKTFCKAEAASHLKEVIQPLPPPPAPPPLTPSHPLPDKTLLRLWKKRFLKEMYRNIQTFAFKVLQEFSSSAPRNGAVQIFFLTANRNIFAENL